MSPGTTTPVKTRMILHMREPSYRFQPLIALITTLFLTILALLAWHVSEHGNRIGSGNDYAVAQSGEDTNHGRSIQISSQAGESSPSNIAPSLVMTNNWTNVFPNLFAVSAVSASEAWAAGEYGHLLHYAAGGWQPVDPPLMRGIDLLDISMASPSAGWIAAGTRAFAYDGTGWVERSLGLSTYLPLTRVSALSFTDAWGIDSGPACASYTQIMHWDGVQWRVVVLPYGTYGLYDIKMTSLSDGWAAGYSCSSSIAILLHYDGSSWTEIPGPTDGPLNLRGLAVTGPNDVWSLGDPYQNTRRAVYHYSASTWTSWLLPPTTGAFDITMVDDNEGWLATGQGIWHWDGQTWSSEYPDVYDRDVASAGGRVWAVGLTDLVLSRTVAGAWSRQRGGPTQLGLSDVYVLDSDHTWAVGNAGTILRYSAGTWQAVTTTTNISADLFGIAMLSATDGYAVGGTTNSGGVIAHWDGANWQVVLTTPTTLRSVYMVSSQEGWAVGDQGAIWQMVGSSWTRVAIRNSDTLFTVAMDSATHGWAGGLIRWDYPPALLEYTATHWFARFLTIPGETPPLRDFALTGDGTEGWAVGGIDYFGGTQLGIVLRLSNGVWTEDTRNVPPLYGAALDSDGGVWAVGSTGGGTLQTAYHYADGTWRAVTLPIGFTWPYGPVILYKVRILADKVGWAVGERGTILRYAPPAASPSPTPTSSVTTTPTASRTATPAGSLSPTETATPCSLSFTDVHPSDYFYEPVRYLACHGAISGYADGTFRPYANTTRGQLCKIVVLAEGWSIDTSGGPHFSDVQENNPFYDYIETAYHHEVISGYSDGTFRWGNDVTRAQLSKIVVVAQQWLIDTTGGPHFSDVPQTDAFYGYIETAYNHSIISGYSDGTFRPFNNATRGQISKIVYNAVTSP